MIKSYGLAADPCQLDDEAYDLALAQALELERRSYAKWSQSLAELLLT
ncbi:MAG: hypothetical protein RRB13_10730 [bacterium]|nr:hypothetical protein [bacterium]